MIATDWYKEVEYRFNAFDSLQDHADKFESVVGSLGIVQNRMLFTGWIRHKFSLRQIQKFIGVKSFKNIYYYEKKHKDFLEVDRDYKRKFKVLELS